MSEHEEPLDPISAWIDDRAPDGEDQAMDRVRLAAELAAVLDAKSAGDAVPVDAARLAAWIDGGASAEEVAALIAAPGALARAEAATDFLDAVRAVEATPPASLRAALRARLAAPEQAGSPVGAEIVPLRRPSSAPAPMVETVYLLAAASDPADPSVVCRSESGVWELRSFAGTSIADREAGRGDLLLTIHPDHAAAYEGRSVRVFVTIAGEERVLAEDVIRGGTLFVPMSLSGLDLRRRDAISVVFGSPPDEA